MKIDKRHFMNYSILIPYLILSVLGLVIVYSTTSANSILSGGNPFKQVINQAAFFVFSLVMVFAIYRMRLTFLRNKGLMTGVILFEIGLLIASRLFGRPVNGAYGWLYIGPISLQAAEYLKLIIVWFLALKFTSIQEDIGTYDYQALTKNQWLPRNLSDWRLVSLLLIILVVIMPDLGNASIIFLTVVVMMAVSGLAHRWLYVFLGGVTLIASFILGTIRIFGVEAVANVPVFGYVAKRFSAFFNPFEDVSGAGHQLAHSYYAMSNGGWFGRGLGNSIEKNGYLPEAHTDFAFSTVFEELGLVGASLILALLFFLILRILLVGIRAKNPFNSMMALGVGGMLLMQTFINVGGISGLIPSTGVTFPFLSQGGNSLLTISIAIAFVLNIDASEKRELLLDEIGDTLT